MNNSYTLAVKWVCNTNCTFCNFYETRWNIDEKKHLEELKNEVEELMDKGITIIKIWVNSYEPTVFVYFFEILDFIKNKGFVIHLFTNGVKLSDEKFTKKLSNFVDTVNLTIYSSSDEEHNILTQNNDSYKIKLIAISICLKNKIKIKLNILLLKPTLSSLSLIFDQINIYFWDKWFNKDIQLLAPNTVMWIDRNRILIPPYTSIIKQIKYILEKYSDIFLKYNIKLQLNQTIPKCLLKIKNDSKILLLPEKQVKWNNKKIITSFDIKKVFFSKCDNCLYLSECNWVELEYINIYWSREFEEGISLKNEYSLIWIQKSLLDTFHKFETEGIWFDFIYLDKLVKEYKRLFHFPKIVLNYYIKDIFILKSKLKRIRFKNDLSNDTFILNINKDTNWLYIFSLYKWDKKNIKIYNVIMILLYKIYNYLQ